MRRSCRCCRSTEVLLVSFLGIRTQVYMLQLVGLRGIRMVVRGPFGLGCCLEFGLSPSSRAGCARDRVGSELSCEKRFSLLSEYAIESS